MTGYVSTRPPEECYLCGHSHKVMAHWSSGGVNRALCHEDDHSCYTKHNHSQAFDLPRIEPTPDQVNRLTWDNLNAATLKLKEMHQGFRELSYAFQASEFNMQELIRYLRPFGGPTEELKYRLNATLRGDDPGPPKNWVGLEEYNNVERSKIKWQTKN